MQVRNRRGVSMDWVIIVVVVMASSIVTYSFALGVGAGSKDVQTRHLQALVNSLQSQNSDLQNQLASAVPPSNTSLLGLNPVEIYAAASPSVVTVQGVQTLATGNSSVLGSGFVTLFQGVHYIVTNFHVVHDAVDISITFSDGNSYRGTVVGTDGYVDLAVLTAAAPPSEFHPLTILGSSQLRVGEPVVAIGNPFGLSGSMTFGIISQVGRTLSESLAGDFAIADVIQFSAPINPGNSGGPLLDANGKVVGITTAGIVSSQGVGFAIPADAILRELPSLVSTGGYKFHSYMGILVIDMDLRLAGLQGTNVTYGVLIQNVTSGGPAEGAGLRGGSHTMIIQGAQYSIGGDIVVGINGTRIVNTDALSAYLQENTLPGQTLVLQIIRDGNFTTLDLTLGTRPPPPS